LKTNGIGHVLISFVQAEYKNYYKKVICACQGHPVIEKGSLCLVRTKLVAWKDWKHTGHNNPCNGGSTIIPRA